MYQVPLTLWNQIAPDLKTPWIKDLASLTDFLTFEEQSERLTQQWQKDGLDSLTASAYLMLAPLMLEHRAISAHLEQTGSADLRQALPELQTPEETAETAQDEYNLNVKQVLAFVRKLRDEAKA